MIDNRRNRIEESQAVLTGFRHDVFGEICRRQRAGGDDDWSVRWNGIHALTHDFDVSVVFEMLCHGFRKYIAIDGKGGASRYLGHFSRLHNQRAQIAHFLMQKTNGIIFGVVGPETVGAYQFSQAIGLMGGRHVARTAHFRQPYAYPALRQLPRCFAAREAATDNLDIIILGHGGAAIKNLWRCTGKSAKMGYGIYT